MTIFFTSTQPVQAWKPPADVYRAPWGWIVKFDLAGVRLQDVQAHIGPHGVAVTGVRRDYLLEEGCSQYSMEISYSRFERTIELPGDLSKASFQLEYRDGLLIVRIRI